MNKLLAIFALILLSPQFSVAQKFQPTLGIQISTFPIFNPEPEEALFNTSLNQMNTSLNPHCIEPGLVLSWENKLTFHNVVFNPLSKNFTNLNIFIGKLDYYCFFSYTPKDRFWFSTFGVSKSFEVAEGVFLTPYVECGFNPMDPKDGSLVFETGIIYSLDFTFKKSKG